MSTKSEKVGLQCLDDETLAQLVQDDVDGYGELRNTEAKLAFEELSRRTPES